MNEDQDGISLLDDFDDDESSLEDPFALGPEGVVRDVLQDELVQRSLSKLSADCSKYNSLADSSAWIWMDTCAKDTSRTLEDNDQPEEPESKTQPNKEPKDEELKETSDQQMTSQVLELAHRTHGLIKREEAAVAKSRNDSSLHNTTMTINECEMSAMSSLDEHSTTSPSNSHSQSAVHQT
tara:strand:+ start:693 stop:1235 length:543 start_codon:yes stop_codon:yes gene_type:complete